MNITARNKAQRHQDRHTVVTCRPAPHTANQLKLISQLLNSLLSHVGTQTGLMERQERENLAVDRMLSPPTSFSFLWRHWALTSQGPFFTLPVTILRLPHSGKRSDPPLSSPWVPPFPEHTFLLPLWPLSFVGMAFMCFRGGPHFHPQC